MNKGVMFSLISIVISGLIILLFWSTNTTTLTSQSAAIETRVNVMNQFIANWDSFVEDASLIMLRSSLTNLTLRIPSKNAEAVYNSDVIQTNITRCLLNGTSKFERSYNQSCVNENNESLVTLLDEFKQLAIDELGFNVTYELSSDFQLNDWAPFELIAIFTINYSVGDPAFGSWNRSKTYNVIIPVDGLPDPLFQHYASLRMVPGERQRLIVPHPKARDLLNKTDVETLLNNKTYYEHRGTGPTYMERLLGQRSGLLDNNNISGIETLIDPADTLIASSLYRNTSFVAHQVFDDQNSFRCGNETVGIQAFTSPDFHIDIEHLARLGFNGSATVLDFSCT